MANKYKGEVSFKAGDEEYVLRFSANAIVNMEDKFDMPIKQVGEIMGDADKLRMSTVRTIFCAGLVDHYAETRPEIDEARAMLIFARLSPVEATALVVKTFNAAWGVEEGGQAAPAANPPPPAGEAASNGTGAAS